MTEKTKNTKHAAKIINSNQRAKVIWLTGLSGSGKTTITEQLNKKLLKDGFITKIIDGDDLRKGLCCDLGYNDADRRENIRRAAEVAKLFTDSGIIVLCCFISPTNEVRSIAENIIGKNNFIEVFVNCPLEICEIRDVKGFYAKARAGKVKNFTGIDSIYEIPTNPKIVINTEKDSVKDSVNELYTYLLPLIK